MCLIALLGAILPRVALCVLWFLGKTGVLTPWWLGFLGFLVLPYTTLAWVVVHHYAGVVDPTRFAHLIVLAIALLADAGAWKGGQWRWRTRRVAG